VQTTPHPPQLLLSVCVDTHWPLQQVFGAPHETPPQEQAQTDGSKVSPGGHEVDTHWPLQQTFGGPQETPPQLHAPATHSCPAGHTVPHPPQLFGSVWVLTHTPLHRVCWSGQQHTHAATCDCS
jgi:hypothetical protein